MLPTNGIDFMVFDELEGGGAFVEVFANQAAAGEHHEIGHFKAFFDEVDDIEVQWRTRQGKATV